MNTKELILTLQHLLAYVEMAQKEARIYAGLNLSELDRGREIAYEDVAYRLERFMAEAAGTFELPGPDSFLDD